MDIITTSFKRRRLPHWEVVGKTYFVTFRLRSSLPENIILNLKAQRKEILSQDLNTEALNQFQRTEFREIEKILDSINNGKNAYLTQKNIAPILMDTFEFLENKYCWNFLTFVIMPNHVHCLCVAKNEGQRKNLTEIIGLFKRYTARKINYTLDKKGRVWVDENFDHWCRNPDKIESIRKYIANNPVKAKLVKNEADWPWKK